MIEAVLSQKKREVDQRLSHLLTEDVPEHRRLYEAMNYSLLAGGKRIRPILFLLTLDALGMESGRYMDAACAIECVHTYSLIHDDLPQMDNDEYRRGRLTNHMVYGAGLATMAGDGLLTAAFEILSAMDVIPPDLRCAAMALLARAAGSSGMVGGQAQDIAAENHALSLAELQSMDKYKTGCLISAPVDMAALLAGVEETVREALHQYGIHLGQLFQITDDLLDAVGSLEEMGKLPGQDLVMKKATYLTLMGMDKAKACAAAEGKAAKESIACLGAAGNNLRDLADYIETRTK